jgi:hypothetical protein
MRKKRLHTFTLIVGSILALSISFSQFFRPDLSSSTQKVKTEQTENESRNETESFISLPSFSLPAPVLVQVNLNPYCLFEIFFEEDIDENHTEEALLYPDRFFETMFRVIISTNAP